MEEPRTRRDFLRLAAGAAATAAAGAAAGCSRSGSSKASKETKAAKGGAAAPGRTLRIAQNSHFLPTYDQWFDDEYIVRWGEEHDASVVVDRIAFSEVASRA